MAIETRGRTPRAHSLGGFTFLRGCGPKTHPIYRKASLKIKLRDPKYPKQLTRVHVKHAAHKLG
jgi:hypothetical protein